MESLEGSYAKMLALMKLGLFDFKLHRKLHAVKVPAMLPAAGAGAPPPPPLLPAPRLARRPAPQSALALALAAPAPAQAQAWMTAAQLSAPITTRPFCVPLGFNRESYDASMAASKTASRASAPLTR